jgi:hypothetical protein
MDDERHSTEETDQRLQKILQGAFDGPPTPLKNIPKRNGKSRSISHSPAKKRRKTKRS